MVLTEAEQTYLNTELPSCVEVYAQNDLVSFPLRLYNSHGKKGIDSKGWNTIRSTIIHSEEDIEVGRTALGVMTGTLPPENEYQCLIVVDIDKREDETDGYRLWNGILKTFNHGMEPKTLRVNTPSGGAHYYFFTHTDIQKKVKKPCYDACSDRTIDFAVDILGTGAFCIAPPSTHPVKNSSYYFVGETRTVAEAPDWLLDYIECDRPLVYSSPDGKTIDHVEITANSQGELDGWEELEGDVDSLYQKLMYLIQFLPTELSDDYQSWFKCCCCLFNIVDAKGSVKNKAGEKLVHAFSKLSKKYNETQVEKGILPYLYRYKQRGDHGLKYKALFWTIRNIDDKFKHKKNLIAMLEDIMKPLKGRHGLNKIEALKQKEFKIFDLTDRYTWADFIDDLTHTVTIETFREFFYNNINRVVLCLDNNQYYIKSLDVPKATDPDFSIPIMKPILKQFSNLKVQWIDYHEGGEKMINTTLNTAIRTMLAEYIPVYTNLKLIPYDKFTTNYWTDEKRTKNKSRLFNTWSGFMCFLQEEKIAQLETPSEEFLFIKKHIDQVLLEDSEECKNFFYTKMKDIFRHPEKVSRTSCLFYSSKQQIGKGVIFEDFLTNYVFGPNITLYEVGIDILISNFNAPLEGKKIVILDELDSIHNEGTARTRGNIIKSKITGRTVRTTRKGVDSIYNDNILEYIALTNNRNAIHIEEHDQRWFIVECSNKYYENRDYFKKLRSCFSSSTGLEFARYCYYYGEVESRPEEQENRVLPMTDLKREMAMRSLPVAKKFVLFVLNEEDRMNDTSIYTFHISGHIENLRLEEYVQKYGQVYLKSDLIDCFFSWTQMNHKTRHQDGETFWTSIGDMYFEKWARINGKNAKRVYLDTEYKF